MSSPRRKKKKAARFSKIAQASVSKIAHASADKAKEAGQFIYAHRQELKEALRLITSVLGAASVALGKPKPSGRRKTRKRKSLNQAAPK